MNSASSYGDADEDRNDDSLVEKVHFASLLILAVCWGLRDEKMFCRVRLFLLVFI